LNGLISIQSVRPSVLVFIHDKEIKREGCRGPGCGWAGSQKTLIPCAGREIVPLTCSCPREGGVMKKLLFIGLSYPVFVAAPGFAQTPPQLNDYRWMVGSYQCAGETTGEGAHPFSATFTLTRDLDGGVYIERYVEAKTAQHQQPFSILTTPSASDTCAMGWTQTGAGTSILRRAGLTACGPGMQAGSGFPSRAVRTSSPSRPSC
jgi:hypothetical protein